jgi:hypothetical protein
MCAFEHWIEPAQFDEKIIKKTLTFLHCIVTRNKFFIKNCIKEAFRLIKNCVYSYSKSSLQKGPFQARQVCDCFFFCLQ